MKEKFSKILVAIDGSKESMDAAEYAVAITKKHNAALVALQVVPVWFTEEMRDYTESNGVSGGAYITSIKGIIKSYRLEAEEKWFNKIRQMGKEKGNGIDTTINLSSDVIVPNKSIIAEIVDYAENNNIDLIVIGTRGRSGVRRLLLGSVASGVVTYAHCPVLVIK
jgi:nucleotide-binding universal stress UspA family protein